MTAKKRNEKDRRVILQVSHDIFSIIGSTSTVVLLENNVTRLELGVGSCSD